MYFCPHKVRVYVNVQYFFQTQLKPKEYFNIYVCNNILSKQF
jgi:hypothetical protein